MAWTPTRCVGALAAMAGAAHVCCAQEYPILRDSTVIGRNFGYPTGTPRPGDDTNPDGRTPVGHLDFVIESAFFLKNLEIDGFDDSTGIDGETFIGVLAPMRVRYRAHERLTFEFGAVLGHDFGDEDELDVAEPLARLVYEPAPNLFILGGTLLPTHWIHDAILDDVQKFRMNAEQGFQFRADTEHWKNDTWINWRIREDEFTAEEFEVANSSRLVLGGFEADGQFLWYHVGGQQNSADRVENHVAGMLGASYGIPGTTINEGWTWLTDARLGAAYLASHNDTLADETGSGFEVRATIDTAPAENVLLRFHAAYFSGDDYLAVRGDPLYSQDDYIQAGAAAVWQLPAGLRAEADAVLQMSDDNVNYTFGIFLAWGARITIPLETSDSVK